MPFTRAQRIAWVRSHCTDCREFIPPPGKWVCAECKALRRLLDDLHQDGRAHVEYTVDESAAIREELYRVRVAIVTDVKKGWIG